MVAIQGSSTHEWCIIGDVLLNFTTGVVSDDVWHRYLEDVRKSDIRVNLAFSTPSGSLTALQRKSASDLLKSKNIRAVVLTDNAMVRGVVTALTWLGTNICAYSYADLEKALADVAAPPAVEKEIREIADKFIRKHLGK